MAAETEQVVGEVVSGVVENHGLLDLTGAKKPEDIRHIKGLKNVGLVLVPEALTGELNKLPMSNVGAIVPVPEGGRLRVMSGQLKFSGDAFASEECKDDMVVLAGQVIFVSPVEKVRVRGLVIAGQVFAPKTSEHALSAAITRLAGQVIYYPGEAAPRVLTGNHRFEEAFFRALRQPEVLVLTGNVDFADDVQAETVMAKLAGLVVVGKVTSSAALKPILQAICTECVGQFATR